MEIKGKITGDVTVNKEVHGDAVMLIGDEILKEAISQLQAERDTLKAENATLKARVEESYTEKEYCKLHEDLVSAESKVERLERGLQWIADLYSPNGEVDSAISIAEVYLPHTPTTGNNEDG